jgi:hypothetical protein
VRLSDDIEDLTILNFMRKNGISPQLAAELARHQAVKAEKSRSPAHDEKHTEVPQLEEQQVDTLEGGEDDNPSSKKRRRVDLKL